MRGLRGTPAEGVEERKWTELIHVSIVNGGIFEDASALHLRYFCERHCDVRRVRARSDEVVTSIEKEGESHLCGGGAPLALLGRLFKLSLALFHFFLCSPFSLFLFFSPSLFSFLALLLRFLRFLLNFHFSLSCSS